MRDVMRETPFEQALALISPPEDRLQECGRRLGEYIKDITHPEPQVSQKKLRAQLAHASKSFWAALKAASQLPRSRQGSLLPPPQRDASVSLVSLVSGDNIDRKLAAADLRLFLAQLEHAARSTGLQAAQLKVPRSGGRTDYRKRAAAISAWVLLILYGRKRPTLTPRRSFFELASLLYEAATGESGAELDKYCRAVHQEYSPRPAAPQRKK